jgi:predicted phage-related endonuclease
MGAYIAVLIGGNTFRWKFIERDEELISMLIQLESDFWECVESNVPPKPDGSEASAKFLGERFPNSIPASKIELPADAVALVRQYDEASEKVEHYTELKLEAENLLKEMIGEYEAGTVGDRIIVWKNISQERIDSTTLKSEHPKIYKKYANIISYRRFTVKEVAL